MTEQDGRGVLFGGQGRICKDARDADAARANRRMSIVHSPPPPWADGPEDHDRRPPPEPYVAPEPEVLEPEPAEPAPKVAVEPEPKRRPFTTVGVQKGPQPEPEPEPTPQPSYNWIEWCSAAALLTGMTGISTAVGLWINPYLGVITASIFLLIIGVTLGVAAAKKANK